MSTQYYSQRQFAPYRGMMHVVETDAGVASTVDGQEWRVRLCNQQGHFWPAADGFDTRVLERSPEADVLKQAFENRPELPFAPADRFELWLLEKESGLPLALLQTRRALPPDAGVVDTAWRAFLLEENAFCAECLRERDAARPSQAWPVPHKDVLERQVNDASRPLAAAQWFERGADGSGTGLHGHRIGFDMQGRALLPEAFPELIVAEDWRHPLAADLVREYHEWNAALLLAHQGLSQATRLRLERAAARRPSKLLEVWRLIFEFIDKPMLDVALVQARIAAAADS